MPDTALQSLRQLGEGTLVAEEQTNGTMTYRVFRMEHSCYEHYINSGAKMHAVNFSCLPEASSRLYVD